MTSLLRSSTRALPKRNLQLASISTRLGSARPAHSFTNAVKHTKRYNSNPIQDISAPKILNSILRQQHHQTKQYTTSQSTTTPTADQLIDELQDLYEVAKDEFEIATDSTDGATIYAASDRESARDALNQLCTVYHLYTAKPGSSTSEAELGVAGGQNVEESAGEAASGPVVETGADPASVRDEVRDEVRKRVGQRVRELRNAVEVLEERAKAD